MAGEGPRPLRALLGRQVHARDVDESAQREKRELVGGLAHPEREERGAEADREAVHLHARPLGHQQMAELVDEDEDGQCQHEEEDGLYHGVTPACRKRPLHQVASRAGDGSDDDRLARPVGAAHVEAS